MRGRRRNENALCMLRSECDPCWRSTGLEEEGRALRRWVQNMWTVDVKVLPVVVHEFEAAGVGVDACFCVFFER